MIKIKAQKHSKTFRDIIQSFPKKLKAFDPCKNNIPISEYFGEGKGVRKALNLLVEGGYIEEKEDFKGLYVFVDGNLPFYTGISKGIVRRIIQHTKGHDHNTSSLAYRIGKDSYQKESGNYQKMTRKAFDFKNYAGNAKAFLQSKNVAFIKIEDDFELYLFEIYCAMELQTLMMNKFHTH
ncbi:MAG TPA: hypothetical protein VNS32_22750 [Flavisolibacter sp.]|nr:hypothetical protein [Flavisolibacter sp.]